MYNLVQTTVKHAIITCLRAQLSQRRCGIIAFLYMPVVATWI